jgi:hypothetical protein
MKNPITALSLFIFCCLPLGAASSEQVAKEPAAEPLLTMPIRFHITQGAKMTVKGQEMEVWVKPEDLKGPVLTELNRIYKPANIQFVIERAQVEPLLKPNDFAELLKIVENSKRGQIVPFGPARQESIWKLIDRAQKHPRFYNVYLFPYVGMKHQGFAKKIESTEAVVGVWTDKPSRGEEPPVKTLLVEAEPKKVGSLARTIAHELGHNLGLDHPDETEVSDIGRLMGGSNNGYSLTPEEIAKARQTLKKQLNIK